MLRKLIVLGLIVAVMATVGLWILTQPAVIPASALNAHQIDLANGQTMFNVGGCASCHAVPGQDDKTRLGGGLALKSPFGTFYAPNISSDPVDGIGSWSETQFLTAFIKGTTPRGDH